tara:strand:- start:4282 stop:4797 length:516 start_codon:yes stop_codon:yes gene_type:complete
MIKLNESNNESESNNDSESNNESEEILNKNLDKELDKELEKNLDIESSESSVESNIINNNEEDKDEEKKNQPTCGAIDFRKELDMLSKDSFDESSEYSYVSIPEDKPGIDYLYYIAFSVGLVLLYLFYNGNVFLTFAEFILNCIYPYIYIPIKLYISKKIIITKLKSINLD